MQAVQVSSYGAPSSLRLVEIDEPTPIAGEVTIDVAFAGVNYADLMARNGDNPAYSCPFVPGLEVAGHIRDIGPGVDGFVVGQPVAALTIRGGYAAVAKASATLTYPLPSSDRDSLLFAAAFPVVVPTAWALGFEVARLRPSESVLIQAAAGGVGTVLAQVARIAGTGPIFGVTSSRAKAQYALGFGYDSVFDEPDWAAKVDTETSGRGVDVVFDSIGGSTRQAGFDVLAPLGRLVCFGNASVSPETGVPGGTLRGEVKSVMGWSISALAARDPARVRAIALDALQSFYASELRVDITQLLPLAQAPRAHEFIAARASTGKLVLEI